MPIASIIVRATWDDEAEVWVASSNDIEGLAVEAQTLEALTPNVLSALSDLIKFNGIESNLPEIPVHIMAEQLVRIPNPVMSPGRPVARIVPDDKHQSVVSARAELFERLERQPVANAGRWTRDELYEDEQQ